MNDIQARTPNAQRADLRRGGAQPGAASPSEGRDFQAAMKKNKPQAQPPASSKGRPAATAAQGERRDWCMDDPQRGMAHVCTWRDAGASPFDPSPERGQDRPQDGEGRAGAAQDAAATAPAAGVPAPQAAAKPLERWAAMEADSQALNTALASRLDASQGAKGQFEILLPSGDGVGVRYEVAPTATHVLLEASSRRLSRQLQSCAAGIGAELSRRTGRQVEVLAV